MSILDWKVPSNYRIAADGVVLPLVVADAVPKVAAVVDQVVVRHQRPLGAARRPLDLNKNTKIKPQMVKVLIPNFKILM